MGRQSSTASAAKASKACAIDPRHAEKPIHTYLWMGDKSAPASHACN